MSQIIEGSGNAGAPAWLPESARRVLLVGVSTGGDWAAVAAIELAELVARYRPRTLLVNTVGGASGPDGVLGTEHLPGLGEAAAGRCRVGEVAAKPQGRSFIFIPAGQVSPGMDQLCAAPAFRHLVEASGRGGTLLLHVTEADLTRLLRQTEIVSGLDFDGLVLLGDASAPADVPPRIRLLARVEAEDPPPARSSSQESTTGRKSGFTRPSRTPAIVAGGGARRRPRGRLEKLVDDFRRRGAAGAGGVVAVWLVAVIAVWLVWQGLSGWPAFEDEFASPMESSAPALAPAESDGNPAAPKEEESQVLAGGTAGDAATADTVGAVEGSPDADSPVPDEPQIARGVDLPYSVLVASHVTYEDAAAERGQLIAAGSMAFVAPTPVGGRLYYRVFAGALEDRVQATDLMRQLVEQGDKRRERDWDMRPVRLAFALGDFASEEEADDERQRLHESGVPAYVLSVGDTTGAVYRLYSGAFESEGAAGPADTLLSVAGQNATLVTRRGEPR